ncbi:unnamed protein product [Choristocarpus tenellus]
MAWFYLIRKREMVNMFPGEEKVGLTKVQLKSHIPKIMFISAILHPDPSHNFDGKIGIWQVCSTKEAQRTTVQYTKGEEYEVSITVDTEWYLEWYTEQMLAVIKEKVLWLESGGAFIQQDSVTPHMDLNIYGLFFSVSVKSRVWVEHYGTDELIERVSSMIRAYDGDMLERV